jgi:hypothetical protein
MTSTESSYSLDEAVALVRRGLGLDAEATSRLRVDLAAVAKELAQEGELSRALQRARRKHVKSLATAPPLSRAIATPRRLDIAPRDGGCGCWKAVGKWPAGATVQSQAQAGHLPTADSDGVG